MWQAHLAASIVTLVVLLATMLCLGTADLLTERNILGVMEMSVLI